MNGPVPIGWSDAVSKASGAWSTVEYNDARYGMPWILDTKYLFYNRSILEQAGIDLHSEPVPPILVSCSTGVYMSLLGNLVRNAMKYMGDVALRRVTVRVVDAGGFIRTEITDTGPGIAPELLPSLFEPYFRGASRGAAPPRRRRRTAG